MKKCTKCKLHKETNLFHKDISRYDGLCATCKECKKKYMAENKEHFKEYRKINYEKFSNYMKQYRKDNKEELNKKVAIYEKHKKSVDVNFKLRRLLRDRLRKALKNNYKNGSAVRDLGCSIEFFKTYIESKFRPGMSWDNHGKWHIDHIIPLSHFNLKDRSDFLIACNYNNLQPLWATENLSKNNRKV